MYRGLIKIKIRRTVVSQANERKYIEVSGGSNSPSVFGTPFRPIIVVESEFDAILIQQEANDLCCCLALGGVGKKPDAITHNMLTKSSLILYALDFDEAGKAAYFFWRSTYPQLRAWPIPKAKSPGDAAIKYGVDLRTWISQGIHQYLK